MHRTLDRLFFEHPDSVGESYGEHFVFAAGFGGALIAAGLAALAHALVPCLFERTASSTVKRLYRIVADRGAPAASATPAEYAADI